jgi:hypothetical protein
MTPTAEDINNNVKTDKLKSNDPEYFKMYQRELYKNKLGLKTNCCNCGKIVSFKSLNRHQKNPKCINNPLQDDDRYKNLLEEIKKLVKENKLTISEKDYQEMIN